MKTIGYIRVSTDKQDLNNQEHAILTFANTQKLHIDEIVQIEISATKSKRKRRVEELLDKLSHGDKLITTELSRLGRNMIETLNIIEQLTVEGVELVFVNQPELSLHSSNPYGKLMIAIYSYFAEAEREFISIRTKQGLAAAKAKGIELGRPKGAKNKKGLKLNQFQDQIEKFLQLGLSVTAIQKLINDQLEDPISYNTFRNYIIAKRS